MSGGNQFSTLLNLHDWTSPPHVYLHLLSLNSLVCTLNKGSRIKQRRKNYPLYITDG
ncbi:hypothetical protein Mapa_017727 [Marchantia paleacea]|nr:hypothetical protein Mapa_017727 [Marchantia paleacea]